MKDASTVSAALRALMDVTATFAYAPETQARALRALAEALKPQIRADLLAILDPLEDWECFDALLEVDVSGKMSGESRKAPLRWHQEDQDA